MKDIQVFKLSKWFQIYLYSITRASLTVEVTWHFRNAKLCVGKFFGSLENIDESTFYLNIKIEMNLTIFNNCHQNERVISCLAEFGEVKNWSECRRKCSQNFVFGKLRWGLECYLETSEIHANVILKTSSRVIHCNNNLVLQIRK